MRRRHWIGGLLVVCGLVPGFLSGVVAGKTLFATSLNTGLLNAFSSVGQNLLGEAAFGASTIPGNPIIPGVQLDVSTATQIPIAMDVFVPGNPVVPGDPCRRVAQLSVGPAGATLTVDANVPNFNLQVQNLAIPGNPIVPAACPVVTVPN
jgi:hypothetical protein